jgi:hypothetical protein
LRYETIHGIGHIGEPRAAPHLTIGADLDSDLMLSFESGEDGSIFDSPQLIERQAAFGVRSAGFEQFGRAQQAADLFGAKPVGHLVETDDGDSQVKFASSSMLPEPLYLAT